MVSWFCEVGGTMRAWRMVPVVVDLVAVEEQASGRLGGAGAQPGLRAATRRRPAGSGGA